MDQIFFTVLALTVMVLPSLVLVVIAHRHLKCVEGHSNNSELHIIRSRVKAEEYPLAPSFTKVQGKEVGYCVMLVIVAGEMGGIVPMATNSCELTSVISPDKVARYLVVVSELMLKPIELGIGGNGGHQSVLSVLVLLHAVEDLKKNYKKGETMEGEANSNVTTREL